MALPEFSTMTVAFECAPAVMTVRENSLVFPGVRVRIIGSATIASLPISRWVTSATPERTRWMTASSVADFAGISADFTLLIVKPGRTAPLSAIEIRSATLVAGS